MENKFSPAIALLKREMEIRNYSDCSVRSYCETMQVFESYANKTLDKLTIEDLKQYLHHLVKSKKVSPSYINQKISAFKIYTEDVLKKEWEPIAIKRPRLPRELPEILSLEEVKLMIERTQNIKHRVMIMTMYTAGLRKMELLQLKPKDIDSENGFIIVRQGKGKKDRRTILSKQTLEELRYYYKCFRPKVYLFEPNGHPGKKMSVRTFDKVIHDAAQRAGIKRRVTPHLLRHSFATHLLDKGINLKIIQSFMGHSSIRTTSIYLHLSNASLKNIVSPFDDLRL
ncbi:MAG: site-specific integrase [Brumimicrobium sp.]|nr:site-specific integrase [Brumimicrobium sp.]